MVNLVFLNTSLFDLSVADSKFGVATAMPRFAPSDLCEKPKQWRTRRRKAPSQFTIMDQIFGKPFKILNSMTESAKRTEA